MKEAVTSVKQHEIQEDALNLQDLTHTHARVGGRLFLCVYVSEFIIVFMKIIFFFLQSLKFYITNYTLFQNLFLQQI